jgi:hypothetical protein
LAPSLELAASTLTFSGRQLSRFRSPADSYLLCSV